ncbi:porin family protein [Sphingomonas sp. RB3P16]|uniref:outer membrane protein n=1 Tax=Parasphingomonas frigoris TaxID=3096163 RepID=UPI002FC73410
MFKLFAASLVAASALVAVPALAQDAPTSGPEMSTTSASPEREAADRNGAFLGFRIEGNAGGDRFQALGRHNDKFGYGASIGFDGQIGERIVIGPEATFWKANDWNENCAGVTSGVACTKSFEEYGVGVRAGVLATPQLLIFGKGGYVTNEQRKFVNSTVAGGSYYDHYNTTGYQVGGGVQYGMGSRFSGPLAGLYVSAQYVYSQYNDHTSRQRVMGGVGLHFK